jgi:Beta protein
MTSTTQLSLSRPEWFQPVPAGADHYVVALQNLPGERDALLHAAEATWAHLTPLVEILGPKKRETDPFTRDRIAAWVKKASDAVAGRPCFLDVLRLPPNHLTTTKNGNQPVLSVIHLEARARGMQFVPVARLSDADTTVRQIAEAAACDARGVALRYPLFRTVSADGRGPQVLIEEALRAVEVDVVGADLIMDLGYLSEDVDVDAEDLAAAIDELVSIGNWRSVVLLGSSMPSTLGGGVVVEGTIGRLRRREWELWSALVALHPSRLPTFGDYAVQNPEPPLEDQPTGPGQRANIRYTTDDATLVPRAVGAVIQEGAEQYRDLCRLLVDQPEFAGRDFTWGDQQIADCADGIGEPGWQNQWRGAGTSHHLRHVIEQLAQVQVTANR